MGLYNRVTPTASSAVINGIVGAPATARLLGKAQNQGPGLTSSGLRRLPGLWDFPLGSEHWGMTFFSPVGHTLLSSPWPSDLIIATIY